MKLKITITMENAAFDGSEGAEAARILRRLADEMAPAGAEDLFDFNRNLRDVNGNKVGTALITG